MGLVVRFTSACRGGESAPWRVAYKAPTGQNPKSMAATDSPTAHPYYPQDIPLPSWRPPTLTVPEIFLRFSLLFLVPVLPAYFALIRPRIKSTRTRLAAVWFLTNALLHAVFEGFWVWNCLRVWMTRGAGWGDGIAGSTSVLAALHREYAKSDSRYLQDDVFVLGIETLTVLIQVPLASAAFLAHLSPKRTAKLHLLRFANSIVYIICTAMYFITEHLRHNADCRPEWVYGWVYMVGMNIPWVVIPVGFAVHDWKALVRGFGKAPKAD
ncbi:hypothetical protein AX16_009021 [Volvariella volvacea WC 439]|nr:hypothetical protein AX16_009021 [Volvariella volvacea WC 439]